jgi:hypothetical protein
MKKVFFLLIILAGTILSIQAQKATNLVYKLDNGITVKTEKCWNNIWVDQKSEPVQPGDKTPLLSLNMRTLGDFSAGSTFKLFSGSKEVKVNDAKPGNYTLRLNYKLSGRPGTFSFDIENVVIKPGNKTTVSATLYQYQVLIDEAPVSQKGLAYYESRVSRYKGNTDQNLNWGIPSFYPKGVHDKAITPDEKMGDNYGKIKPGTYDVLISIEIAGRVQKIWLENFIMKPDVSYKIVTNLNGGVITYSGVNRDVKIIHLYPVGTSGRQSGTPAPDKNTEIMKYDPAINLYACPPGSYDVLLSIGNGLKYEWRKNIIVHTGARTDVK